ncbi:MAG: hypothetical protein QOE76_3397 [Frankiales bacterium]|nr:hypothetical protein [Frankiales bacterium]
MIVRRLATVTAAVTIALAGGAAVPSIASASSGHPQAKPARGVAWTSNQTSSQTTNKAGKKPSHGVAWTGAKPVSNPGGVTWTGQRPAGVAWTR